MQDFDLSNLYRDIYVLICWFGFKDDFAEWKRLHSGFQMHLRSAVILDLRKG